MGELLREAQQAGLFDGPLSTCETELQELLRQIDIMLSNKHQEWMTEIETVKLQCQTKEHEVMVQQTKLEASQRQVAQLNDKIEGMTSTQKQLVIEYEQQLSQLKSELSNLQRDYDRVQKHHSKQASNAEKARDQTMVQLQEKQQELMASKIKLQEYESQVGDWEIQHRGHRQQVEELESQRTTLTEKYHLMQQQSLGYQEQLSKRRQMLEQSEINYHSRLTHLEGQLSRMQDALEEKNANIQNLEERLIDADCQKMQVDEKYNKQNKHLEVFEKTNRELQIELQSRDDLIAASEQNIRQRNQDVTKLEESLLIKDNIIRTLKESNKEEESLTMITEMKQQVIDLQAELVRLQQNECHWRLEVERLQSRLDESHIECASLNTELAHKIDKLRHMEGTDLRKLAEDLLKARSEQQNIEERHQAQIIGMKKEIAALTSDLHQRDAAIASYSSKSSGMERQLRVVNQQKEKQSTKLQLTNTHVEGLMRKANHNLQEARALNVSATSGDLHQAEIQLQELEQLHRQHVESSKSIEAENDKLKREYLSVQQQLQSLRRQSPRPTLDGHSTESAVDPILGKDRKLQEMESQHRKEVERLQDRLQSATKRYEEEIGRLRQEQERLRQELKNKAHSMKKLQAENNVMGGFISSAETISKSPPSKSVNVSLSSGSVRCPRSPASRQLFRSEETLLRENHSFSELFPSPVQSQLEYERPNSRTSITASFVAEDTRRRRELEQLLESHMTDLEQRTDETLQRHLIQQNVGMSQQGGSSL